MWRFFILLAVVVLIIYLAAYHQLVPVIQAIMNGLSSCSSNIPAPPPPSN